jgi:bacillithiol biosynthesis deacetylase BshB1
MILDVLAVGAHPDDVELGCGGTLINLHDAGYRAGVVDLTDAALSTRGDVENRRKEADAAANLMGISERFRLGLKETSILSHSDSVLELVSLIRKYRPHIMLAPYWEDRHPDHADASQLVQRAAFWAGVSKFGDAQPPHRPHRIVYYFIHTMGPVSFAVDISSVFDRKLRVVRAFRSQFLPQPGSDSMTFISRPEFLESLISRARFYGAQIGAEYAEPFHVRELSRVEDLVGWAGIQGVVG